MRIGHGDGKTRTEIPLAAHRERLTVVGIDADELESALAEDPSVGEIERTTDEAVSYRMHWVGSIETLVHVLLEEGTILVAESVREGWFLCVLFPDRDSLSRAYGFCNQNDLSLGTRRIYDQ